MKKILNTMQHALTSEQETDLGGMFGKHQLQNLRDVNNKLFKELSNISVDSNLKELANELLDISTQFDAVILPIGSPAFMFTFSRLTHFHRNSVFMFAHSDRIAIEKTNDDGTMSKTSVFKHVKFLVM
jgi:hypothetical protein